jgi:hypothetical protein
MLNSQSGLRRRLVGVQQAACFGTLLGVAGAFSQDSQAATVYNRYCVDWDLGFSDVWSPSASWGLTTPTGLAAPDDIWSTDMDAPARGVSYLLYAEVGGVLTLTRVGFLAEAGSLEGCTEALAMDSRFRYTLAIQSVARVGDDTIRLLASTQDPRELSAVVSLSQYAIAPSPGNLIPTRNLRIRVASWTDIVAAATKTLERFDPPSSNQYVMYPYAMDQANPGETDPSGGGQSFSLDGVVFVSPSHRSSRYVIAHELGHAILNLETGGGIPSDDSFLAPPAALPCPTSATTHGDSTVEYASKALSEGWADYVAATTWNRTDQADCWYRGGAVDWDANGSLDVFSAVLGSASPTSASVQQWQDCEGDSPSPAVFGSTVTTSGDYLGNTCLLEASSGLGNEMDWRRMFWDVRTETMTSNSDLLEIIAIAKGTPSCWVEDDSGPIECRPNSRMATAAQTQGGHAMFTYWLGEAAYNGVEP